MMIYWLPLKKKEVVQLQEDDLGIEELMTEELTEQDAPEPKKIERIYCAHLTKSDGKHYNAEEVFHLGDNRIVMLCDICWKALCHDALVSTAFKIVGGIRVPVRYGR